MKIKIRNSITEETFEYILISYILSYRVHDKEVDKVLVEYRDKDSFHIIFDMCNTIKEIISKKAVEATTNELKTQSIAGKLDSLRLNDDEKTAKFLYAYQPKEQVYEVDFYEQDPKGNWLHTMSTSADFVFLVGVNETLREGFYPVVFIEPLSDTNDLAFSNVLLIGATENMKEVSLEMLDKALGNLKKQSLNDVMEEL